MKTILNLTGVQKLSKEEQREITGAVNQIVYCDGPRRCCITTPIGPYCDYGYCQSDGRCIWA